MLSSQIRRAVHVALAATTAGVSMAYVPVAAAQDSGVVNIQEVVVTGSRIRRPVDEAPLPVSVFDRADIEASGEISISEVIRSSTFNSFGSFAPASGSGGGATGSAVADLRGLGSGRTLVLVDGRRVSSSPAFSGVSVNLNTIPLAAVERVDILRDGASAIYGSDAIGGVINIITRKDFEGISVEGMASSPSEDGGDEAQASMVAGWKSDRGSAIMTLEHAEKDIIWARSRPWTATGVSQLGNPGTYGYVDGTDYIINADPRCATADYPLSAIDSDGFCTFRSAAIAGETSSVKRDSFTLQGNYEISDSVNAFVRSSYTRGESFGRYAPAPASFGEFISPTNPINPTAVVDAAGNVTTPGQLLDLYYRFNEFGPRDSTVSDNVFEVLTGLNGQIGVLGGLDWEAAIFHNRYDQKDVGTGYGLISEFQNRVAACETEGLDSANCYNPFQPAGPDNDASAIMHTILNNNEFVSRGIDLRANANPFSLPAGDVGFAVGFEYREDDFSTLSDAQADAGNVFGSSGGSAQGDRNYKAAYIEALVPIVGTLEGQVALRYDDYSDFGSEVSPKLALSWRPTDWMMVRGSWGEGFAAPDLSTLYSAPIQSFEDAVDTLGCQEGYPPGASTCSANQQRETNFTSNPDLDAETSEQYSLGVRLTPTASFAVSLDYYNIRLEDTVYQLSTQEVLDFEADCFNGQGSCSPGTTGYVVRDASGRLDLVVAPAVNAGFIETDGLDFAADYAVDTDIGRFKVRGEVSYVLSYEQETLPGTGVRDLLGYTTDDLRSGQPDWRGTLNLGWAWQDFDASVAVNHIDSFKACTAPQAGAAEAAVCSTRPEVDSFTTADVQASWSAPWNGILTVGVRNVTNEEAPQSAVFGSDRYSIYMHSDGYYMRVPYIRYKQNF